jgi:hypothetical protein
MFRRISPRSYYSDNKFPREKKYKNVSYVLNWHCRCLYTSFLSRQTYYQQNGLVFFSRPYTTRSGISFGKFLTQQ